MVEIDEIPTRSWSQVHREMGDNVVTPYVDFPAVETIQMPVAKSYKKPKSLFFPHCCTGSVLVSFGESFTAEGGFFEQDVERLEADILNEIRYQKRYGSAFISATTNDEQIAVNKVLLRLGFSHSKWMSKELHPDTKVRLWWLALN